MDKIAFDSFVDISQLIHRTVLITGATGMIGFSIINALLDFNEHHCDRINILALVRNVRKAEKMYKGKSGCGIKFIVGDVTQKIEIPDVAVDYIIHCACPTSSMAFVNEPVEVIRASVLGTMNMLELALEKKVRGVVYLSSMEVYGSPDTDEKICENHGTNLDTMSVRTSYPESKRMCEALCCAYFNEYKIPVKVIRMTQTFGTGAGYDDKRVFAEFVRCAIEKRDIILHTKGETKRSYLYTGDAVSAILLVLLSGKPGEAYNAANEETYCSIYEMAKMVAKRCANSEIAVKIELEEEKKYGYAPALKMNLDVSKLKGLGWHATKSIEEMFDILCASMKEELYHESRNNQSEYKCSGL